VKKEILLRLKEATFAILPIMLVLFLLVFSIPGMSVEVSGDKFGPVMASLLISIPALIIGIALFTIGAEKSIAKIGEKVSQTLTKKKKVGMLLFVAFLLGVLTTLAEPDLSVLANRIHEGGPSWPLIIVAALGVGAFMVIAVLRVIYNKPLRYWLVIGYGLVFTLGAFANHDFFTIIFDAGGVTTGVITVPFIISFGVGVARVLGGEKAEDDSFGYSGLCSLGAVLMAMIFSIILNNTGGIESIENILGQKFDPQASSAIVDSMVKPLENYQQMGALYATNMVHSIKNVSLSIAPIVLFFIFFQLKERIRGKELLSIIIGFVYTYIGIVLFFLGAESGFIPFAFSLGKYIAVQQNMALPLLILFSIVLGFISMLAEPSVGILANTVNEVSLGVISKAIIYVSLGVATSFALLLNSFRITYDIDFIYFIIPLFIIAMALSFITPEIYVGIAIDAAGVATGTMASCFFLPMFIGYTSFYSLQGGESFGNTLLRNGFGVVGLMSIMPIIAMEFVGIIGEIKMAIEEKKELLSLIEKDDNQIIHLPLPNEE